MDDCPVLWGLKPLPDGRWQFQAETGAWYHIRKEHLLEMLGDIQMAEWAIDQ